MSEKIFYKVVQQDLISKLKYSSYAVNSYNITYAVGSTTSTTNGTPLFIFNSLDSASEYAYGNTHCYACRATNVRKPYRLVTRHSKYFDLYWALVKEAKAKHKNIANYLKQHMPCDTINYVLLPPLKGTLWCDSVTLLHEIF